MRAVAVCNSGDKIEDLQVIEIAKPTPQGKEVLIKVAYASLNPVDYKLIQSPPAFWAYPYVVGLDLVGEVVALGSEAIGFTVGDLVATHGNLTFGGALAEYVVKAEHTLFKIPRGFDLPLAAALPCAGLTAYQALVRKMNIKAGKTIFIQAGSGGVGSFAIIIAKFLGLEVISSCSTRNLDYVQTLGADVAVDYTASDVYAQIKTLYPQGVDYILETTHKANLQRDLEILAFNGQIASIVGVLDTSSIPEFSSGFGFHEVALGGAYLSGHYPSQVDLATMGDELVELLQNASRQPNILLYPFEEYQQAFRDLQTSKNAGKIVLQV